MGYVGQREPKYQCIIVVSWHDLYPEAKMNFELGQGSSVYRCAVMSFGRFEPRTFSGPKQADIKHLTPEILWQFLKVSAHEVLHVFGLKHFTKVNLEHWLVGVRIFLSSLLERYPELTRV